jgi:hypothetical protein
MLIKRTSVSDPDVTCSTPQSNSLYREGEPLCNIVNALGIRPWRCDPPMFFRSLFYERNVLMHLEPVQQLSAEVQAEIAKRLGNFIEVARSASDLLQRFAQAAREEKERAVELGTKSDMDPLWAAPAISEACCKAKLGLATGSLDANTAIEIIVAIEKFRLGKERQIQVRLPL